MLSNRLAFAALAVACIAAAAGGGYLASRQNAVPAPAAAQGQPVAPTTAATPAPAAPAPLAERPVQETEAVVAEPKTPVKSEAPKVAAPKRVEKAPARAAATRQQPPPLASTWPSSAAGSQPPAANAPALPTLEPPAAPKTDEHVAQTPPAPEAPQKQFEELVVSRDSVIGLQTENRISSETARVEDRVEARVTRDVKVADRVAIPAGARGRLLGTLGRRDLRRVVFRRRLRLSNDGFGFLNRPFRRHRLRRRRGGCRLRLCGGGRGHRILPRGEISAACRSGDAGDGQRSERESIRKHDGHSSPPPEASRVPGRLRRKST